MESGMISVDRWSAGSQAYFLTHLHADHTAGLSATWRRGPLFCSRLTAKLLPCKFPGIDLSLLRIVDIGTWHSLSLTSPSTGSPTDFVFKAIDAQHCPGAVMYLFRGDFGCMLFTGDFRWETSSKGMENGRTVLLDALKNQTLDILHLDNTYCNPIFSFPSREVAARQVIDIITSHPDHEIVIAIDSLGKEDLLLYISQTLNIKIWVWPERLQFMHLLGFHQNFTTQTSLTRVRAIPRYSFSNETLEALNTLRPTIGIMPSGLPWALEASKGSGNIFGCSASGAKKKEDNRNTSSCSENSGTATRYNDYIFVVPYSDHSCYSEIQEFIELLRPVNIRGIVSSKKYCIDPRYYFDHLCGAEQALWRVQQKLEHEEGVDRAEVADIEPVAEGNCPVVGRKRKLDQIDFFGIRVSRVSLLRRLCRGAKIADTEPLS
ncbi:DNA repair metallo-beta-lactamase family protein [Perilla frutescens var. hirtella]|nr:DNA repair metallo-beta-lactamase family protein [Perilla frutescens var. frutescens]KAH6776061.1 DNA repair metallo-beta-lactamase family protein [Perilla frutescens var. hirtella]